MSFCEDFSTRHFSSLSPSTQKRGRSSRWRVYACIRKCSPSPYCLFIRHTRNIQLKNVRKRWKGLWMDSGSSFLSPTCHWPTGSQDTWPKVQSTAMNLHSWFHIPNLWCWHACCDTMALWSGSRDIARRLQFCDCVIEVHDARVSIPI